MRWETKVQTSAQTGFTSQFLFLFQVFLEQILLQPLELGMRWETNIQTGVQT
jgi:hypothetical protein